MVFRSCRRADDPHSHEPLPWPLSLSLTVKNLFWCDYKALMFSISIPVSLTEKLLPTIVVLVNFFWRKELFHRRSLVFTQLESFYSNFQYLLPISTQNKIVSCVNISFKIIYFKCQILINPYVPLSSPLYLIFLNSLI